MKKALGGILSLGLVLGSVSPALAATMLDKDLAQFTAGSSSPTLDFNKGSSKIYENGNFYIVTDDQIYLNAPVATNVQDDLNVGANLRVTGTGIYTGTQTFNGSVTLGNEATDVITATGYFTQARIGTGATFGHIGTVGPDELGVEGAVEIDGAAYLDSSLTVAGATSLGDGLDVNDALGIGYVATLHQTSVGTASGEVAALLLQNDGGDVTNDYLVVGKNASATVFSVKAETGDTAISGALAVNGATTLGNLAGDLINVTGTLSGVSPLKLGGATDNAFEMTVTLAAEPTADVVITVPDITGTLVTTGDTNSVSDAMVVNTITASNYLLLAGGTLAGQVVFYNAAAGSGTTEGSVYYSTADDNLYVYADGGWVDLTAGAAGATSLDTAYNTDAGERTIVVDDGAVSWDMSGAHSLIVDIQGTGSFVVQHDSVAAFTLADGGAATIAGSAEGTAALTLTAGDLVVTDGDLTLSGGEFAATSDDATGNNFAFTTAATSGVGLYVNGSTVTTGDAIKATIASATMTTGKALNLYDGVTSIFSVADDGATVVKGTAEATAALTLTTGDILVSDGDLTLSGGELSATTGATTGVGHAFNVSTVTTGQGFRITYDESNLNAGTIIEAYGADGAAVDWSVGEEGAMVIRGVAEATAALTLTAGDAVVTNGDITVSSGEMSLITDDTDTDAVTFDGDTLTTGQTLVLTYDNSTHSGNIFEISDHDSGVDFAVADGGATTLTGAAEGTAVLTLTAGNLVVTDGDLTLSGGEISATAGATDGVGHAFNVATVTSGQGFRITYDESTMTTGTIIEAYGNDDSTVDWSVSDHGATVIRGVAEGTAALTLTAGDAVLTDGDLTLSGGEISATAGATDGVGHAFNVATVTTGQGFRITYDESTMTTGTIIEAYGNDDSTVDWSVSDHGATVIRGVAEGTAALTLTAGDVVVTNGDLTISSGEIAATSDDATGNNFAFTAAATTGVGMYVNGGTVTEGDALKVAVASGTMTTGKALNLYDGVTSIFSVADDGATVLKGTAENTAVLTLTAGDLVVTDGDLTISSGEVTLGSNGVGADLTFYTDTATESWVWDDTKGNVTVTNIAVDETAMNLIDLKITDNTSTSGDVIGISLSQESGSGAGFAAGIDIVNNDNTAMTIGERIRAVTGNITTALQIIASAGKTIATGLQIGDASGTITTGIDISTATVMTDALSVGVNQISGSTGNINYSLFDMAGATGKTDWVMAAAGQLTIDAATTDNTTTTGVIDLNLDSVTDGFEGINMDFNVVDDAGIDTLMGMSMTVDNNAVTADDVVYGLYIDNEDGAAAADALVYLKNSDTDTAVTDGIFVDTAAGAITDAIDVSDAEITNAINVGANTIAGTTAVVNFSQFDLAATGKTDWVMGAAGQLTVDATATANTTTSGVIDLNIGAGNAAVIGTDIGLTQNTGADAATDAIAQNILLTANDADGDMFGIKITGANTATAAAGSYEAAITIDNADDAAGSMPDAIIITSSGVDTGVTDAIDVSTANITNAINVGANVVLGTTGNINYDNFDMAGATGKTDWILAAAGQLTLNAATTDNTTTDGVIKIAHDSTSSSQAIAIVSAVIDDNAVDTQQGILVTMTNSADDSDVVYGVQVAELGGAASGGNEYAIYQAGTAWDYGLYVADDAHFNTKVNLGKMTSVADPDTGAITITASYFEWTPAGAGTATLADGSEGDIVIIVNEAAAAVITLSDAAGNIQSGAQALDNLDTATFVHDGTDWVLIATTNN